MKPIADYRVVILTAVLLAFSAGILVGWGLWG